MNVVYLAGPYDSKTEHGVHCNIQAAETVALEVWRLGAVCICPHKNTAYFGGALPTRVWLDGDEELIRRSDVVLMMTTWRDSPGAHGECDFAHEIGKPVVWSLAGLQEWMTKEMR